jgi:acyl-CoA thioesterase I
MKPIVRFILIGISVLLLTAGGAYLLKEPPVPTSLPPAALSLTASTTPDVTIIAFGDSLTAGYGLPSYESYPAQLEAALKAKGASVRVVNAGVSGETTRGSLERAPFIRAQGADIVLLGIGGNDALRVLPLDEMRANINATLDILLAGSDAPKVVLLRMQAPLNAGEVYKNEFDAMYAQLAAQHGVTLVPFITADVFLNDAYKIRDGIHLNKSGYGRVVEEYILPGIEDLVRDASSVRK